jgi:hypothetical protein
MDELPLSLYEIAQQERSKRDQRKQTLNNSSPTRAFIALTVLCFAIGLFLLVSALDQGGSGWHWHSGPLADTSPEVIWCLGLVAIALPVLMLAGYVFSRLSDVARFVVLVIARHGAHRLIRKLNS